MLLRGKWRCFLFRKHFSNPSHIYLRSLKPAEDDHFPSAQLSDTRFISHIWLYRAETLMCVSIILAEKKKNDNQAIVSALGVTTKMSYHLPSHPPHSFFIFSFGSAARAEMSTYTTQMMVNDARSRRILVRCRLTPRLKHAWLGGCCQRGFEAKDSWLWQAEAEWRLWAPAKLWAPPIRISCFSARVNHKLDSNALQFALFSISQPFLLIYLSPASLWITCHSVLIFARLLYQFDAL